MRRDYLQSMLREEPELFKSICRFNVSLSANLHVERRDQIAPERVFAKVVQSPRGQRRLSNRIRETWDLELGGFWEFQQPLARLALLDFEAISRLTRFVGAMAFRSPLSRVIDRSTLDVIKKSLDPETYHFAVKRSSFLVKRLPAWFDRSDSDLTHSFAEKLGKEVQATGLECFAKSFASQPKALVERLQLKLPSTVNISADNAAHCDEAASMVLRVFSESVR
ncbi:MAG: SctK family type III secretion system sorting platform protein [Planctomycetota bacterium]